MRVQLTSIAALVAAGSSVARAQEHAHAASERLGRVHFATSCAAAITPQFDRAVALLHSFEFGASIRAFDAVLASDSTCAMAHWGVALSRWSNPMAAGNRAPAQLDQGRAAATRAATVAARPGSRATARERGYIDAVAALYADYEHTDQRTRVAAYERAMAALVAQAPTDTEAGIFHALALTASAAPSDKSYAKQLEAGATLERLWIAQPDHPGLAHYIIHTYDVPALAGRAQRAAARYARIAPSAAHALHMPSHTFTRVGQWKESVETNRRSMDIARREASIAEALHAADYLAYAYLQMRRDSLAKSVLDGLPALAARFDVNAISGAAPGSAGVFALAAIPARYALERRDWRAAAALVPRTSAFAWTDAMVHFARALGAARTGDTLTAAASIDSLGAMQRRLMAANEPYWAEQVAVQQLGAQAWLDHGLQRTDSAFARMQRAAAREDATEKSAVTPGPLAPARELLGDMYMESRRYTEALAAFRATLVREPNRFRALDGARRAAAAAGDRAAAARYATQVRRLTGA